MLRRDPAAGRVTNAPRRIRFGIVIALAALAAGACGTGSRTADPSLTPGVEATPADRAGPLDSLEVVAYPDGPAVVLLGRPQAGLAAVRLSVPLTGAYERVGVARVLDLLVRPRMHAAAAALGAAVRSRVTEQALVFSVIGPATDLEGLVRVARIGIEDAAVDPAALDEAAHRVRAEALAESETPAAFVRRQLGAVLFPLTPTRGGDAASTGALGPADIRAFRREFFAPERLRAVVVGPYSATDLAGAFSDWPAPEDAAAAPRTDSASSVIGGTQVVRPWLGAGWPVADDRTAELLVASRVIGADLRGPAGDGIAEVWWSGGDAALVLIVPGERGTPMDSLEARARRAVGFLWRTAPEEVSRQAIALADGLLLDARTAGGAAALIGDLFDRTGDPLAASWLLLSLTRIDGDSMIRLAALLETVQPAVVRLEP